MNLLFIHGLEGSSQGMKAAYLRDRFPDVHTPDFTGSLDQRMGKLLSILQSHPEDNWTLIGSSFGGLMAALYAKMHPQRLDKLILLAPALVWPDFALQENLQVDVPTIIYHGTQDDVIPIDYVRSLAERSFTQLKFNTVDDDHMLHRTVRAVDWLRLISR
ncbi:MAG: alpha/beta fold hydrolase [Chloroflexi bacterium]|jgi:pimeloyl-ACP methyl ester carboxylesterase|nr:alpha/beta fold hydrolase [Chloroflexota bacterium]